MDEGLTQLRISWMRKGLIDTATEHDVAAQQDGHHIRLMTTETEGSRMINIG